MTAAAATAPLPFSSASAAAEFRNMQLDYRLFGHATERNPRKHWNPDPWTDRIARIQ